MRGKVISRFAAGTFGICMIYSVVSQALLRHLYDLQCGFSGIEH